MMISGDLTSPLDDTEFDELDAFLLSLEDDDATLCISEFDGFITAVVSGPDMIPPSEWLKAVWGSEDNAPVWDSEDQFQRIFTLMIRHMNSISATLTQAPMEYEPCFLESQVEDETFLVVDEWCTGYMKGLMLRPHRLRAAQEDMTALLGPIPIFGGDESMDTLENLDHTQIRSLQDQVAPAARAVHAYWLEKRSLPGDGHKSFTRPEPKTGRNDPCPCGSGKKYKKCCGLQ